MRRITSDRDSLAEKALQEIKRLERVGAGRLKIFQGPRDNDGRYTYVLRTEEGRSYVGSSRLPLTKWAARHRRRFRESSAPESTVRPPPIAEGLFWLLLPCRERDAIMGDAMEAYAQTLAQYPNKRLAATLHYCKEGLAPSVVRVCQ